MIDGIGSSLDDKHNQDYRIIGQNPFVVDGNCGEVKRYSIIPQTNEG